MHSRQHDCSIAGMVTRGRILLLIRIFMFLIHNDQSQVLEWQEERRTYTQHYHRFVPMQEFVPYFHTLVIREFRMIYQELITEQFSQPFGDLRRNSYFRKHI